MKVGREFVGHLVFAAYRFADGSARAAPLPLKWIQEVSPHTISAEPVRDMASAASEDAGASGRAGGRDVGSNVVECVTP